MRDQAAHTVEIVTRNDIEPQMLPKDAVGEGGRDGRSTVLHGDGRAMNGKAQDHDFDPLLSLLMKHHEPPEPEEQDYGIFDAPTGISRRLGQ